MIKTLRKTGILAPEWAITPPGCSPYFVKAFQPDKTESVLLVMVPKDDPGKLMRKVFTDFPETVDYSFEKVSPKMARWIGRESIKRANLRENLNFKYKLMKAEE